MKAIHKKIIYSFNNSEDYHQTLIKIILNKIPWFSSKNHQEIFDLFEKIIFTILSFSHNFLQIVFKFLLLNMIPE